MYKIAFLSLLLTLALSVCDSRCAVCQDTAPFYCLRCKSDYIQVYPSANTDIGAAGGVYCNCGNNTVSSTQTSACVSCAALFGPNCNTCGVSSNYPYTTACTACNISFTVDNGQCKCATPAFFLNPNGLKCSNLCVGAIPGCTSCSFIAAQGHHVCTACSAGYTLNATSGICDCSAAGKAFNAANGNCVDCNSPSTYYQNCATCSFQACTTCQTDFASGASGKCECNLAGCKTCSSTQGSCSVCLDGWSKKIVGSVGTCVQCGSNCKSCNVDTLACTSCYTGYYKTASNTCEVCDSKCSACIDSPTKCTACTAIAFISNDVCTNCGSYCISCPDATSCSTCQNGAYQNGDECLKCPTGCLLCSSTNNCTSCLANDYFLNAQTLLCDACSSLITGCKSCSSNTVCTVCQTGWFLNTDTFTCTQCTGSLHCQTCTNSSACTTCPQFYTLNDTNGCQLFCPEVSGCDVCSSPTQCTTCNPLYLINTDFTCDLICDALCTACSGNSTNCSACINQADVFYDATYHSCANCSHSLDHCVSCTNISACTACASGYYVNSSGLCFSCDDLPGCTQCNSLGQCTSCDPDYFYINKTCVSMECSDVQCGVCDATGQKCYRCLEGFEQTLTDESYLNVSVVTCDCSNNEFSLDDETPFCFPCESIMHGCSQCYLVDPDNYTIGCQTCTSPWVLNEATHQCQCPQGNFISQSGMQCVTDCSLAYPGCSDCAKSLNGSTICSTCTGDLAAEDDGQCHCTDTAQILIGGSCVACSSQIGCKSCDGSPYCTECHAGYDLWTVYDDPIYPVGTCVCHPGCDTCDNDGCTSCLVGFKLHEGVCYICPKGCFECYDSKFCITCLPGFFNNATNQCNPCPFKCQTCINTTYCTDCAEHYFVSSGVCALCESNCLECSSSTVCTLCNSTYYLRSDDCLTCVQVHPDCLSCDANGNCLTCPQRKFVNGSFDCQPCQDTKCLTCSSVSVCTGCETSYWVQSDVCKNCTQLHANCVTCRPSDGFCTQCPLHYWLKGENCQACGTRCDTCNDDTLCLTCLSNADTYYNVNGVCKTCSQYHPHCSACNAAGECTACSDTYFLNAAKECSSCFQDCVHCPNATHCTACVANKWPSTDQTSCLNCASLHQHCTVCEATEGNCTTCAQSYEVFEAGCRIICSQHCTSCTSATNCLACAQDWWLQDEACVDCVTLHPNCDACQEPDGNCTTCADKYVTNGEGGCKIKCAEHCVTCDNDTYCTVCEANYWPDATHTCAVCTTLHPNCTGCNTDGVCQGCDITYFLATNGNCSACGALCNQCTSATSCTTCQAGHWPDPTGACKTCQQLTPSCGTCNANGVCTSCSTGFYLNGASCFPCSQLTQCSACSSTGPLCTTCNSGYYVSAASTCISCNLILNCSSCSNDGCTKCSDGFFRFNQYQCNRCNSTMSNCDLCSDASTCLKCGNGKTLSSGTCVDSPSCPENCAPNSCNSPPVCSACNSGFYLENNLCVACGIPNCNSCIHITNTTFCTACAAGFTPNADSCVSNNSCSVGCTTCINSVCYACNKALNFILDARTCVCPFGSTLNATLGACVCPFNQKFNNNSQCVCLPAYAMNAAQTGCSDCSTIAYYNTSVGSCTLCGNTCLTCSSSDCCTSCDATLNRYKSVCSCLCKPYRKCSIRVGEFAT